jgi:polysaccharide export outer membrane protein
LPSVITVLAAVVAAAGFLTGCGASLDGPDVSSGDQMTSASTASTALTVQGGGTGAGTPGDASPISRAADSLTSSVVRGSTAYRIGPQDIVDFSVFKVPELSRTVQVADAGTINLPLVGEVLAAGKTSQELEHDLKQRLGADFLQNPQVTVYVKEYNSQRVTVDGAVMKPGVYPVRGRSTLLQVIATAGGLDPNGDTTVVVFRYVGGKRSAGKFDLSDIRAGKAEDPVIREGDVIVASTSTAKETLNMVLKILPLAGVFAFL